MITAREIRSPDLQMRMALMCLFAALVGRLYGGVDRGHIGSFHGCDAACA
jgi:hypothetical protein